MEHGGGGSANGVWQFGAKGRETLDEESCIPWRS